MTESNAWPCTRIGWRTIKHIKIEQMKNGRQLGHLDNTGKMKYLKGTPCQQQQIFNRALERQTLIRPPGDCWNNKKFQRWENYRARVATMELPGLSKQLYVNKYGFLKCCKPVDFISK